MAQGLFRAQKVVLGTISDNDTKHYFTPIFGRFFYQVPLCIVMATPTVPCN